jgi:arginyl-tRNA synthetase
MSISATPQQRLQSAIDAVLRDLDVSEVSGDALRVVSSTNPQFGDYQFNGALSLAKAWRQKPRDVAARIVEALDVSAVSEPPEIAGPGFVNFKLKRSYVEEAIVAAAAGERQGVAKVALPRRIVVDYPSPNVAKPLHVGHIRTTFIGDAIVRLLRFVGHEVISDNHVGDWGTPIGKVILGWKKYGDEDAFARSPLDEMGRLYKLVNAEGEANEEERDEARRQTMLLQQGDPQNRSIWEKLRSASQGELDALYLRLGVKTDVSLGESFYNDRLAGVISELVEKGIAQPSQGALIIPFTDPHLADKPMLVRKSDGSALYATTDLATVAYRMERWHPDEIIYVVDVRQSDHFRQLFAAVRLWGYDVALRHVAFGTILGDNGRPISTREGVTSKLSTLVDESQRRALETARSINPELSEAEL